MVHAVDFCIENTWGEFQGAGWRSHLPKTAQSIPFEQPMQSCLVSIGACRPLNAAGSELTVLGMQYPLHIPSSVANRRGCGGIDGVVLSTRGNPLERSKTRAKLMKKIRRAEHCPSSPLQLALFPTSWSYALVAHPACTQSNFNMGPSTSQPKTQDRMRAVSHKSPVS